MEFVNKVFNGIFGGTTETTITTGEEVTTIVTEKTTKEKVEDLLDIVSKAKEVIKPAEQTAQTETKEQTVKQENKKTLFYVGGAVALIVIALIAFKFLK